MTKQELNVYTGELQKLINERDMELEAAYQKISELETKLANFEKLSVRHNERNAGRKKADEKWMASFTQWRTLYESQKSINEIMEKTGISRATYYRYKRLYDNEKKERER